MIFLTNIAALVAYTSNADEVTVEYYNTPGDGGGGVFYWKTGTATNDSGTVFNSTGGLTGGYWQRITDGQMATPEWFGAYGDGSTDDYTPLINCIAWAASGKSDLLNNTTGGSPTCTINSGFDYGQVWAGVPPVYLSKVYATSQEIILPVGSHLTFLGGTILAKPTGTPLTALPFILGTNYTDPTHFANRGIQIDGKGFLDGNCISNQSMACVGLWANVLTQGNISGLTIVNVQASKWSDIPIASFTGSTLTITGAMPAGFAIDDVCRIYSNTTGLYGRSMYTVADFSGGSSTITLDTHVISDPIFDPINSGDDLILRFMPTAFSLNGTKNTIRNCSANNNGLGYAFGCSFYPGSTDLLDLDDNYHESLLARDNNVGAAYMSCFSTINVRSTFQFSVYENLIIGRGAQNLQFRQLYSEVCPQFAGATLIPTPPNPVVPVPEYYPLNYVCGGNIDIDCECPVDPAIVTWFRAFQIDGTAVRLKLQGIASSVANPNNTSDFSLVRLTTNVFFAANVRLAIAQYTNLQTLAALNGAVVSITGSFASPVYSFPNFSCFIEATDLANGHTITAGTIYGEVVNLDSNLSLSANHTVIPADFKSNVLTIFANASGGNITITLVTAASLAGYTVNVIKTDSSANTVTIHGNGSELINAANTYVLSTQYSNAVVKSNGTQNYLF